MGSEFNLVMFGEVLFDHLPGGDRVMGGAPLGVAWHLKGFGLDPLLISAVGADAAGEEILAAMQAWGLRTDGIQVLDHLPTGRVDVRLAQNLPAGEPAYTIPENQAWDTIEIDAMQQAWPRPDPAALTLLYHGSLALRSRNNQRSFQQLLKLPGECVRFMDVNLRNPWVDSTQLEELLLASHWVKMNEQELYALAGLPSAATEDILRWIAQQGNWPLLLTCGADGAHLLGGANPRVSVQPVPTDVVNSTVGAGDAFTAAFIFGLVQGDTSFVQLRRAQRFASRVLRQPGAITADHALYQGL